jgi:murein DD-endopeptidase MepM/ murein hydrolase activator NlpD
MDRSTVNSNFKNYNGVIKAEVMSVDDPEGLGRVQVMIPSYHGSQYPSGDYPWAQVSAPILHKNTTFMDQILSLFHINQSDYAIRPSVGDKVWIMCEGGDIRYPVYLGVISRSEDIDSSSDDGSAGSNSSGDSLYVSGGNLASIAANIISGQEGSYTSIEWNDAGASSIGRFQWRAGRAKELLKSIRTSDQAGFDTIINAHSSMDFVTQCMESSEPWDHFLLGKNSSRGAAVQEILGTDPSHKTQDSLAQSDCQGYINAGKKYGLKDNGALIFFADCYNQNPAGAIRIAKIAAASGGSLAAIYNAAMADSVLGKYSSRRTSVYNSIKKLQQENKLNGINGDLTSDAISGNSSGKMPWPVKGNIKTITSGFGPRSSPTKSGKQEFHYGIDISGSGALGKPVIATINGTTTVMHTGSNDFGNSVRITSEDKSMYIIFGHLLSTCVSSGQKVTTGTVIGALGNSGQSTGPHLHFQIDLHGTTNASAVNPLPYLTST